MDIFGEVGKLIANRDKIARLLADLQKFWKDSQPELKIIREQYPEIFTLGRDLAGTFFPQMQHWLATGAPLATISVRDLQQQLCELGYYKPPLKVDNDYGPGTTEAVRAFQRDHGLATDGWAGFDTLPAVWMAFAQKQKEKDK